MEGIAYTQTATVLTVLRAHVPSIQILTNLLDWQPQSAQVHRAILDIRSVPRGLLNALVTQALEQNPSLQLTLIVPPTADPLLLFDLAKQGVWHAVSVSAAEQPSTWLAFADESRAQAFREVFAAQLRARWQTRLSAAAEQLLFTVFVPRVQHSSVKELAATVGRPVHLTPVAKRKALWNACRRAELAPPDVVLGWLRVVFCKLVLDSRHWTTEQLVRYLRFPSKRAFFQTLKRRSTWTWRDLQGLPLDTVVDVATSYIVQAGSSGNRTS